MSTQVAEQIHARIAELQALSDAAKNSMPLEDRIRSQKTIYIALPKLLSAHTKAVEALDKITSFIEASKSLSMAYTMWHIADNALSSIAEDLK